MMSSNIEGDRQRHTGPCGTHMEGCGAHAEGDRHSGDGHAAGVHPEACGTPAGLCCQDFVLPTTDEAVTIPANDLAGLLDLIEELAEDPARLVHDVYRQSKQALAEQAPRLVAARADFLNRMKALLAEAESTPPAH